jgi:hypothetical protein
MGNMLTQYPPPLKRFKWDTDELPGYGHISGPSGQCHQRFLDLDFIIAIKSGRSAFISIITYNI